MVYGPDGTGLVINLIFWYVMLCTFWYHLYNLKNGKNIHGGVLASAYNFTKSNTSPWIFLTFFKLYKWYQIALSISYKRLQTPIPFNLLCNVLKLL